MQHVQESFSGWPLHPSRLANLRWKCNRNSNSVPASFAAYLFALTSITRTRHIRPRPVRACLAFKYFESVVVCGVFRLTTLPVCLIIQRDWSQTYSAPQPFISAAKQSNMAAVQASKAKDVSTVAEPLLDDNPDRYCMFPIKYPVSTEELSGSMPAEWSLNSTESCAAPAVSTAHSPVLLHHGDHGFDMLSAGHLGDVQEG
jgi:hypothetical protein